MHLCPMQNHITINGNITTIEDACDGLLVVGVAAQEGARRAVKSPGELIEVHMTIGQAEPRFCTMYFVYKPTPATRTRYPLPDFEGNARRHTKEVVFSQMVAIMPPQNVACRVVRARGCMTYSPFLPID